MNIEKALEQEKGRILRPEHVIEAMKICQLLANWKIHQGMTRLTQIQLMDLISRAQSLMKDMEEAEKKHLDHLRSQQRGQA